MRLHFKVVLIALLALFAFPRISPAHGIDFAVQQIPDSEIAAVAEGETYTIGQIKILLGLRKARFLRGQPKYYNLTDLMQVAQEIPVYKEIAATAQESGVQLSDEQKEEIEKMVQDYLLRLVYRDHVLSNLSNPTMKQLEAVYEDVKDEEFRKPAQYLYQEIVIPYDSELAREAARSQIKTAWMRLEEGESFPIVASDFRGESKDAGARTLLVEEPEPDQAAALSSLATIEDRAFSEPYETNDSWRIAYRYMYIKPGYFPFQSVIDLLMQMVEREQRQEIIASALADLADDPSLFLIHEENLVGAGELALETDQLLTVCGDTFTRKDIMTAAGWYFSRETQYGKEEFKEIVLGLGIVQGPLIRHLCEVGNYAESEKAQFYRASLEETEIVRSFLLQSNPVDKPTESEIADVYTQEAARLGNDDAIVNYDRFIINDPDTLGQLDATLQEIDTYQQFQDWAENVSSSTQTTWIADIREAVTVSPEAVQEGCENQMKLTESIEEDKNRITLFWIHKFGQQIVPKGSEAERIKANLLDGRRQATIEKQIEERIVPAKTEWTLNLYN